MVFINCFHNIFTVHVHAGAVEHARNFLWDEEGIALDMPLDQPTPPLGVTGESHAPSARDSLLSGTAGGSSRDIINALQKSMDEFDPSFAPVLPPGGPDDGAGGGIMYPPVAPLQGRRLWQQLPHQMKAGAVVYS